jgi:ATP-binding cassette subfamily B protein
VIALFLLLRPMSRRANQVSERRNDLNDEYARRVAETVGVAREIRVHDVAEFFEERLALLVRASARARTALAFLSLAVPAIYQSLALLFLVVSLAVLHAADVSVVSAGAVILLLVRASSYGQQVQTALHFVSEAGPTFDKIDARVSSFEEVPATFGASKLGHVDRLELRDVSFAYEADRPVLLGVTAVIERGEVIGVIGPSGSGKSTLVQLLLRLRAPSSGAYLVNGRAAADYDLSSWAAQVAFVPQDAHLFTGTVAENIQLLRPGIAEGQVVEAARAAGIHDEIVRWPMGYATEVGDRGSAVSGGQRQRISIARALVGRPEVVVLDEPTSALDVHSESAIQATISRLRGDCTVVVIAHRMSTLAVCDRIMVLREGRVQGFAAADELRRSDPYYAEVLALSGLS